MKLTQNFYHTREYSRLLTSVTELSQLFPPLDDDLCSVGTHFTFDHLTQPAATSKSMTSHAVVQPVSVSPTDIDRTCGDTQNELVATYNLQF